MARKVVFAKKVREKESNRGEVQDRRMTDKK